MTRRRRLLLGAVPFVLVSLAASCSSGSSKATPHPSSVTSGSSFCVAAAQTTKTLDQLTKKLTRDLQDDDLAGAQRGEDEYLTAAEKGLTAVQATLTTAPADVRAAMATELSTIKAGKRTVDAAKSLDELQANFSALGTSRNKRAQSTLNTYAKRQCGSTLLPGSS